jgi:uncharacterized protein YkwD
MSAGENLAKDYFTAEEVLEGWKDSLGHQKNLVNKTYVDTGIGFACDEYSCIVVQHYASPMYIP